MKRCRNAYLLVAAGPSRPSQSLSDDEPGIPIVGSPARIDPFA